MLVTLEHAAVRLTVQKHDSMKRPLKVRQS